MSSQESRRGGQVVATLLATALAVNRPALGQTGPEQVIALTQLPSSASSCIVSHLNAGAAFGSDIDHGDIDTNGIADFVIGTSFGGGTGTVQVLFMNADGTVRSCAEIGSDQLGVPNALNSNDQFGVSVAVLGDLDGDGYIEIGIGADQHDWSGTDVGAVWIVSVDAAGAPVKPAVKISNGLGGFSGQLSGLGHFGSALAKLGDLDGDGVPELAVGAPNDDDGQTDAGAVWILFLNSDGSVRADLKISNLQSWPVPQIAADSWFGRSITCIGDLNGDGVPDLAVGAPGNPVTLSVAGAVWILFLNGTGAVSSTAVLDGAQLGLASGDQFGLGMAWRDASGPCGPDGLYVGAPGTDAGGTDQGAFWRLRLDAAGNLLSAKPYDSLQGGQTPSLADGDAFGFAIDVVDGGLIVGAAQSDLFGTNTGVAYWLPLNGDWVDLGGGVYGSWGPLLLDGTSTLCPPCGMHLSLSGAPPFSVGTLIVGVQNLSVPFKGGTFVPFPNILIPLATNMSGSWQASGNIAQSLPAGFSIYMQVWFKDATASAGWTASNGLCATFE